MTLKSLDIDDAEPLDIPSFSCRMGCEPDDTISYTVVYYSSMESGQPEYGNKTYLLPLSCKCAHTLESCSVVASVCTKISLLFLGISQGDDVTNSEAHVISTSQETEYNITNSQETGYNITNSQETEYDITNSQETEYEFVSRKRGGEGKRVVRRIVVALSLTGVGLSPSPCACLCCCSKV
ncbi:hypothetical protein Pcinc_025375 [Petrolisthes cinctipes]|uniref:Uncharacterized protein n=1 Tax=Petrolisthes cinctipes TaxID=88211 RepID=A0AAE1FAS1_PETCI|nr:hypothetical protein Pcinc_025375 [Petrolisthes cinctipes]